MNKQPMHLGWKEWCALPDLGLPAIKAKVDTGAKTSVLHTFQIEPFTENGREFVRFWVHPLQRNDTLVRECVALLKDQRMVRDSGGHKEQRYVIETSVQIGNKFRQIELSLTNRDTMLFRMLIGRRAMQGDTLVNPSVSYINGRLRAKRLYGLV